MSSPQKSPGERCKNDFQAFMETYFPAHVPDPFTADQLEALDRFQRDITGPRSGALRINPRMQRYRGQTTYVQLAALWSITQGYDPFVLIVTKDHWHAEMLKESLLLEFESYNAVAREQLGLRCRSVRFGLIFERDAALGIVGQHDLKRSLIHKLQDGRRIRPTLIIDDIREEDA